MGGEGRRCWEASEWEGRRGIVGGDIGRSGKACPRGNTSVDARQGKAVGLGPVVSPVAERL